MTKARHESVSINEDEVKIGDDMVLFIEKLSTEINDRLQICDAVQQQLSELVDNVKQHFIGLGCDFFNFSKFSSNYNSSKVVVAIRWTSFISLHELI